MKRNENLGMSGALLAVFALSLIFVPSALATSKTLYTFTVGSDGYEPIASLIFDQSGNLYGTTSQGGSASSGSVFKLTPNGDGTWTQSVLYSFQGGTDGAHPAARLIFDQSGNLYGTTAFGGSTNQGTVFELTPSGGSWTETVLHTFGNSGDGAQPFAGLVFDSVGNLYGTTEKGGAHGGGAVFKLTPNAAESVLYSFCSVTKCGDGKGPMAGVILDRSGNLCGTTQFAGANGDGVVFKLTPRTHGSWKETVLHSFIGSDGSQPIAGLIFDASWRLYGTTLGGGAHSDGVVFKLTHQANGSWAEKVLHSFSGSDGVNPADSVIFDQSGNLYGTTTVGGAGGFGVAFKLAPNSHGGWHETVLLSFTNHPDNFPDAGLIFDGAGNLYGTTFGDGSTTHGSVFEIMP